MRFLLSFVVLSIIAALAIWAVSSIGGSSPQNQAAAEAATVDSTPNESIGLAIDTVNQSGSLSSKTSAQFPDSTVDSSGNEKPIHSGRNPLGTKGEFKHPHDYGTMPAIKTEGHPQAKAVLAALEEKIPSRTAIAFHRSTPLRSRSLQG